MLQRYFELSFMLPKFTVPRLSSVNRCTYWQSRCLRFRWLHHNNRL